MSKQSLNTSDKEMTAPKPVKMEKNELSLVEFGMESEPLDVEKRSETPKIEKDKELTEDEIIKRFRSVFTSLLLFLQYLSQLINKDLDLGLWGTAFKWIDLMSLNLSFETSKGVLISFSIYFSFFPIFLVFGGNQLTVNEPKEKEIITKSEFKKYFFKIPSLTTAIFLTSGVIVLFVSKVLDVPAFLAVTYLFWITFYVFRLRRKGFIGLETFSAIFLHSLKLVLIPTLSLYETLFVDQIVQEDIDDFDTGKLIATLVPMIAAILVSYYLYIIYFMKFKRDVQSFQKCMDSCRCCCCCDVECCCCCGSCSCSNLKIATDKLSRYLNYSLKNWGWFFLGVESLERSLIVLLEEINLLQLIVTLTSATIFIIFRPYDKRRDNVISIVPRFSHTLFLFGQVLIQIQESSDVVEDDYYGYGMFASLKIQNERYIQLLLFANSLFMLVFWIYYLEPIRVKNAITRIMNNL